MKKRTAPDMLIKNIQELNNLFLRNAFSLITEASEAAPGTSLPSPGSVCNSPSFCSMLQLQQAGSMKIAGQVLKSAIWDDSVPFSLQVPLQHYMRCLIYLAENEFDCRDYICRAMIFDQRQEMFYLFIAGLSNPSLGFILISPENMEKPVCPSPGIYGNDVPVIPVSSISDALEGNTPAGQQAYNIYPEAASNVNKTQPFTLAFFAKTPLAASYDTLDILFLYGRESDVYQSIQWETQPPTLVRRYITGNEVLRRAYALSHDADTADFLQNTFEKVQDAVQRLSSMDGEMEIYSLILDSLRNTPAPENIFLDYILRSLLQSAHMWNGYMELDAYKEFVCRQIDACRDMADVWNQLEPYIKKPGMIPRQEAFHATPYYLGFFVAPANGLLPFMLHYLHHMFSYVNGIDKCELCSAPVFSAKGSVPVCQACSIKNEMGSIRDMCINLTPSVIYFRKKSRNIGQYLYDYRSYMKNLRKEIISSGEKVKEKTAYVTEMEAYLDDCQKQVSNLKKKYAPNNNNDIPQDSLEEYIREIDAMKERIHERYVDCKSNILFL